MADASRSSIGVRVRPNANGFIADLRSDLASKKYTFYVDIKAKTQGATRDVKTWAATELRNINAKVYVGANTSRATGDMARWRERQAQIKTTIHVVANAMQATREVEAWRKIAGRDLEIKVKANVSGRLTEIERIRKAAGKEAKMVVRGDTSQVNKDIQRGIDNANQMSMFTVQVDADTNKAKYKINEFIAGGDQLEFDLGVKLDTTQANVQQDALEQKIKSSNPAVKVRLETLEARRDLAKLKLDAERKKLNLDVDVKLGKWDKFSKKVDAFEKSFGNATVIRSLDFGPINLGKPTGLVGTVATITAMAGLVPGVVTGVAALSDALMRLAGAAAMVPGAIASIGASFGTFQVGAFGFTNALDAMFKVWTESTDKIERNQRNTIKWTNDLSKALDNEKQAQRAVGDARRDATNELRNLNNELRGSVLNEAQAILDLQRARDKLAQGDFENATERVQAQLDVAKAEQNIYEVRERNTQLNQRYSQQQQRGVEGSDQVTQAMEQQARATEAVALAMQSLSMANPMGAQSLFEDAMDRLSPKAKAAVEAIGGLRGEITDFQRGLQDVMFDGVAERITSTFQNLGPTIMPGMNAIAQGLNENILQVFDTLNSAEGKSIIERILGGTAEAQKMMSGLIDPLIRGFGTLMAAGAEHMPQLIQLFTDLADRFALFIKTADDNGTLDKFLNEGIDALGNLAELGINVVKIMNDFSNAFRTAFGTDLLTKFVQITDKWHEFLSSEDGQKRLNGYIADARDIWNDWKPILERLPEIFDKVQNVAMRFLDVFLPVLDKVAMVLERVPGLVELFAGAWIGGKMFTAGKAIFQFGKLIFGIGGSVKGLGASLGGFMSRIAPYLPFLGQYFNKPGALPPFLPGDAAKQPTSTTGGGAAATGGAAGEAGGDPKGKPQGKLGKIGSALGKVGSIVGKVFTPLAIGLTALDVWNSTQAASTAYDQWQEARNAAPDEETKRRIDKEIYASLGIDIGESGKYPVLTKNQFNGFAAPPEAMAGTMDSGFTVKDGKLFRNGDDKEWPLFAKGGLTDWPTGLGRPAILHGQEFVLPADSVAYYGKDFMEALQRRQIPPMGFSGGGEVYDPLTGQWVPAGTPVQHGASAQTPGILNTAASAATGAAGAIAGAAPGPIGENLTTNIGGLDVNLGPGIPQGWPGGQAPVGLGGGPDGFDIRNFGIGPGPAGSTPADWLKWGTDFTAGAISSLGGAVLSGFLGIFGLEGAMSNPYISSALGLGAHFLGAGSNSKNKSQASGADQSNADALSLINLYNQIPGNPAYPGVPGALSPELAAQMPGYGQQFPWGTPMMTGQMPLPGMPGMPGYIPANTPLGPGNIRGSESGLQKDTIRGRRALSAAFPMLPEIGGVRADKLKWHPNGLALDAMIPGDMVMTPQGLALGDTVTQFAMQNADELGIIHVIWRNQMYYPDGKGGMRVEKYTGGDGTVTGDHFDHPHIAFKGAGMPDKNTKYLAPSRGIIQYALNDQGFPVVAMGGAGMTGTLPGFDGSFNPADYPAYGGNGGGNNAAEDFTPVVAPWSGGIPSVPAMPADPTNPGKIGSIAGNDWWGSGGGSGGPATPTPAASDVEKDIIRQAALRFGMPESEMSAFMELVNNKSAIDLLKSQYQFDPDLLASKTAALAQHISANYDKSPVKALNQFRAKNKFSSGGPVWGAGSGTSDSIPAMLSNGEHVLTAEEVKKMGGQQRVYAFREALRNGLIGGFAPGGAVTGVVLPKPPPIPPRPPMSPPARTAQPKIVPAQPKIEPRPNPTPVVPRPVQQAPAQSAGPGVTQAPTMAPPPIQAPAITPMPVPQPAPQEGTGQGPQGSETTNQPSENLQNNGPGAESYMHLHPAIRKGISSGMAVAGSLASMAAAAGTMGIAGAAGAAGAMGGGGGGGGGGLSISGAFQQGGKVIEDAANIGASFLVGNITGGTTSNAFGVTQMANTPTGGTKIYDASTSIGSIHTSDLDEYYRQENRRQAQRAQSGLGHWGSR